MIRFAAACCLLLALGIAATPVTADASSGILNRTARFVVDNWQSEQGLPQNTVWAIHQSTDGYLWIGTDAGAARFDGSRFVVFDAVTTDGLIDDIVRTIEEDREGTIWFGTQGGGLIRYRNGEMSRHSADAGLTHDIVLVIRETGDGSLWVGTEGGGLGRLRGESVTILTADDGLPGNFIKALHEDSRGMLWVGTFDGLALLDAEDGRVQQVFDSLAGVTVNALAEDPAGTIWVGTESGLLRVRDGSLESAGVTDAIVYDLVADGEGTLWAAGVGLFRIRDGEVRRFATEDGLSRDQVLSIAEGDEGSLWVGTNGGGLDRLRQGVFRPLGVNEGLSENFVTTIRHDEEGFWVATWGGGLNRFHDGRIEVLRAEDGLVSDYVTTTYRDSRGTLWIGTSGGGLRRMLPDGTLRGYTTEDGLSQMAVTAIGEDEGGTLWVGTGEGLDRMIGERFEAVETPGSPLHEMVHIIFRDSRGDLWVGRAGGLVRIHEGGMEVFRETDGLADDTVYAIHEDSEGAMWIGTDGGLSRLRDERFVTLKRRNGLPGGVVYAILEDDEERLWLSCNQGVYRLDKAEVDAFDRGEIAKVRPTLYGTAAGMRSRECSGGLAPAGVNVNGRLWFSTIQGLVTVDPADLGPSRRPPRVVLDEVFVNRRRADPRSGARAPRGEGELEFRYFAVSLLNADDVRYRYRLEGFEEEWREVGSQRSARYTNVPPGEYGFRVAAAYSDGTWSETGLLFPVLLMPRLYQTRGFQVALVLLVLGVCVGGYLVRTRQVRSRERRLARLVDERTRKLKETMERLEDLTRRQSSFVSGISHELKTPLTLIRLYAETLLEHVGSTMERREMFCRIIVREVERLTRLVDRVLDFSRIEQGVKKYDLELGDLRETVRETVRDYEEYLHTEGLGIRLDMADDVPCLRLNADAVSMAIINLLENAAKYSGESNHIEVRVQRRRSAVTVEVEDRGVGISRDEQERIFDRFYRVGNDERSGGYGVGLFVVREVMSAHGGSVEVESEPGRGSTFRLVFPATESATPDGGAAEAGRRTGTR
jgi:signal transduction histidine kinase/ligand-binding sensor domain-containing protein